MIVTVLRLIKILIVLRRYRILTNKHISLIIFNSLLFFIPRIKENKYVSMRLAFEKLGPVFIKFGQMLSTRPDILSKEFTLELSKLQNKVEVFDGEIAYQLVVSQIGNVFLTFNKTSSASASIAQVHKAVLITGETVAVKIMRPNIIKTIQNDINLLKLSAYFATVFIKDAKLLRPKDVVLEFEKIITNELNFLQEAANGSELARLHTGDEKILIPKIYHKYCKKNIIVMEWMDGIEISDAKNHGLDLIKLSHYGVEIFYTQVFYFGFFHADMHPGNILLTKNHQYIALDFGIMCSLSQSDKRYLAINILAFFNRDYRKVAITHIESGWVSPNINVEEFAMAIRTVCEPIFSQALADISFAQVLINLFYVSRRFGILIQPQLILLQKTILNVETLVHALNPQLDLWATAKPILQKWLKEQIGIRGFLKLFKDELPNFLYMFPTIPRDIHSLMLKLPKIIDNDMYLHKALKAQEKLNYVLLFVIAILSIFILKFI